MISRELKRNADLGQYGIGREETEHTHPRTYKTCLPEDEQSACQDLPLSFDQYSPKAVYKKDVPRDTAPS